MKRITKEIKDYIHYYIGCDVCREHSETRSKKFFEYAKLVGISKSEIEPDKMVVILDVGLDHFHEWYVEETKPILRKLSSMTDEEAIHIAWFNMDSEKHLDKDARISKDDINANVVYNDGGLLVDEDAAVVIDLTCRCFEGQVCIRNNGDIEVWSDAGEKLPIERHAENVLYLLSKGFDLFGLIDSGIAIEKDSGLALDKENK